MIFSFILVVIAGISKGIMDTLQFHYFESTFSTLKNQQWWNPKLSWKNKYIKRGNSKIAKLIEYLDNSFLVFITDGWHMVQSIFLTALMFAIVLYQPITPWWLVDLLILRVGFGLGFKISYK